MDEDGKICGRYHWVGVWHFLNRVLGLNDKSNIIDTNFANIVQHLFDTPSSCLNTRSALDHRKSVSS
jgi:hypothetical protein